MRPSIQDARGGQRRQLRTRIEGDLVLLNLLVLALVFATLFFPSNVARIILGLPFVLFFPGFALVAALYPAKDQLDGVQRLALSLGLSIAVVVLIGLVLNYTPWGITLEPVLYSIAAFVLAMSVVAWIRRRALPSPQRSGGGFRLKIPAWQGSRWDKGLSDLPPISIPVVTSYSLSIQLQELVDGYSWHHADVPDYSPSSIAQSISWLLQVL